MKSLFNYKLPIALLAVTALATAANADNERYRDRMFDVVKTTDVVYAKDVPHLSKLQDILSLASALGYSIDLTLFANETDIQTVDLTMDIFTPDDGGAKNRAAVIVAHGGAFIAGAKDDDQKSIAYCDSLAARGFVTASIQYRLGVTATGKVSIASFYPEITLAGDLTVSERDYARAVYRGVQDINAAVRFLRANATEYGIDPERIYVLGNSAGAIMAIENIYANSETDFPDYVFENENAYDIGGLNDYGEQGVDFHANGAVALWGATHNPKILGYNKTPVFLAHGSADDIVLFKTGKPVQDANSMIPSEYSSMLAGVDFTLNAPVLYGSYVIDSALTVNNGSKKKPETYFVEGAKHEFYNKAAYTATTQTKVFEFLYNLAKSDKVVRELAGVTIAKVNVDERDSLYAVIDGGYDGKDTLNITKEIEVSSVKFDRTFIENVYSTITLPFSVNTSEIGGLSAVLRYNGIGTDEYGNDAVRMKVMWATDAWVDAHNILDENNDPKQYSHIDLNANYPYLVQMSGSAFSINNKEPITLKKTTVADTTADGWTFHGTWEYKKWESGDTELGVAYGFAASSPKDSKIKVGDFVRIGEGTWITPMRAYLVQAPPKSVRANGSYVKPRQELPEFMSIVIDNEDGKEEHTTVIGQFNTRTGEFKMNYDRGKFDLKGRRVNGTNNARGAYYGRKVLMK
ncbi:MAG: alpha/beta hydrolase [Fibrobacter sp.]|nr:alpha/beta hydrolase [Fibrobacter sp.]